MTGPRPIDLPDAELYEHFRDKGLSHGDAVLHVERRRRTRPTTPTPREPSKLRAALVGGAQGATSGFADEILGAMEAIRNPNIPISRESLGSSIQAARGEFSEARSVHPLVAGGGHLAGAVVNPLNKLLGPLTQGVGATARGATFGAVHGGALGAGEADGSLQDRALGAGVGSAIGGTVGLAGGFLFGRTGKALRQMWQNLRGAFQKTEREVTKALGKGASPETVRQVSEAAHRAYLQKQGFPEPVVNQLMDTWRAGGRLPAKPPVAPRPEVPITTRPGETVTEIPGTRGRGLFGPEGSSPPPRATYPPSLAEMQGFNVRGTGQTLPYYPRGGAVEQGIAPRPVQSPTPHFAPNQNAAFAEFLKGATPEELPARIETLRTLGVPLTPAHEAELMQLLLGATR